jgi:hypothetical protein
VGRYKTVDCLNKNVKLKEAHIGQNLLRQRITYEADFGNNSKLTVTVSLDKCTHYNRRYNSYHIRHPIRDPKLFFIVFAGSHLPHSSNVPSSNTGSFIITNVPLPGEEW